MTTITLVAVAVLALIAGMLGVWGFYNKPQMKRIAHETSKLAGYVLAHGLVLVAVCVATAAAWPLLLLGVCPIIFVTMMVMTQSITTFHAITQQSEVSLREIFQPYKAIVKDVSAVFVKVVKAVALPVAALWAAGVMVNAALAGIGTGVAAAGVALVVIAVGEAVKLTAVFAAVKFLLAAFW